jgi:hypothetical protein
MLRERKYKPVISAFERLDWLLEDPASGYMLIEQSNFSFGDPNDGRIDLDKLAWYANYKTDEFVTQIARKVDRFRKDEKITELLREINAAAQKKDGQ